jgi:hypothetical protein
MQALLSVAPAMRRDCPAEQVPAHSPATPVSALNLPTAHGAHVVAGSLSASLEPAEQSGHGSKVDAGSRYWEMRLETMSAVSTSVRVSLCSSR